MPELTETKDLHKPDLTEPARYFPIRNARYSAGAGLFRFGHDFGNDKQDQQLFQFDCHFPRYLNNVHTVRRSNSQPYYCHNEYTAETERAVTRFLCQQLALEHPAYFQLHKHERGYSLDCQLSKEQLQFDAHGTLLAAQGEPIPPYRDSLDAIASQCQEDIALMSLKGHDQNWLSAIHLCAPNHWCPQTMSGKDMQALHKKVPGFERANPAAEKLLAASYNKGPYVRFAWGLQADDTLNRHPTLATQQRAISDNGETLFMRIERQVLWPVPDCSTLLFTIRTHFLDCSSLNRQEQRVLYDCLLHMENDSLDYKGIDQDKVFMLLTKLPHNL